MIVDPQVKITTTLTPGFEDLPRDEERMCCNNPVYLPQFGNMGSLAAWRGIGLEDLKLSGHRVSDGADVFFSTRI